MAAFRILLVLFILIGGIGFILYHLLNFFLGINSTRSKIDKDKGALLEELDMAYSDTLIELNTKELELLSLECDEKISTDGLGTITIGHYPTIYNERLIAYAVKNYFENDNYLVVVKTKNDRFIFDQFADTTQVLRNGIAVGKINDKGELLSTTGELLADIKHTKGEYHLISNNEEQLIHLRNSNKEVLGNQRVFPIAGELSEADPKHVLILTLYDLLIH